MSFATADCPVARALDVIGDWWSLLIIRDALEGVRRFGAFQSGLGIAKGMLAVRLRDLVERGVLTMEPASDGSAYKDYVLTDKGRGLFLAIVALRQWGEEHLYRRGEPHSVLVEAATGKRVGRLALPARDGHALDWAETRISYVVMEPGAKLQRNRPSSRAKRRDPGAAN